MSRLEELDRQRHPRTALSHEIAKRGAEFAGGSEHRQVSLPLEDVKVRFGDPLSYLDTGHQRYVVVAATVHDKRRRVDLVQQVLDVRFRIECEKAHHGFRRQIDATLDELPSKFIGSRFTENLRREDRRRLSYVAAMQRRYELVERIVRH